MHSLCYIIQLHLVCQIQRVFFSIFVSHFLVNKLFSNRTGKTTLKTLKVDKYCKNNSTPAGFHAGVNFFYETESNINFALGGLPFMPSVNHNLTGINMPVKKLLLN